MAVRNAERPRVNWITVYETARDLAQRGAKAAVWMVDDLGIDAEEALVSIASDIDAAIKPDTRRIGGRLLEALDGPIALGLLRAAYAELRKASGSPAPAAEPDPEATET